MGGSFQAAVVAVVFSGIVVVVVVVVCVGLPCASEIEIWGHRHVKWSYKFPSIWPLLHPPLKATAEGIERDAVEWGFGGRPIKAEAGKTF